MVFFAVFFLSISAFAEYRVFTLHIINKKSQVTKQVETTLDPLQYSTFFPLKTEEEISYIETWRCKGRTDFFKPHCDNPRTNPTNDLPRAPAKAQNWRLLPLSESAAVFFWYTDSMADSVQNKKTQQTYLRQINQEKAERRREIMSNQKDDIKSVRDYYADQTKQLESESAAAISHINEESRQIAAAHRAQRAEQAQAEAQQKRDDQQASAVGRASSSAQSSSPSENLDKKKTPTAVKLP